MNYMVMAIHLIAMKHKTYDDLGTETTKVSKGKSFFCLFFLTKRSFVVKRFAKKRGVVTKLDVRRRMEIKDIGDWSGD